VTIPGLSTPDIRSATAADLRDMARTRRKSAELAREAGKVAADIQRSAKVTLAAIKRELERRRKARS